MYNPDTDFIFPSRVIPALRGLIGAEWSEMCDAAAAAPEIDTEHLSFVLLMVGLNGCESCNADSYKAMRGCTACSVQTIERFPGTEADLKKKLAKANNQVEEYRASIAKRP
jgi:hypothetical protein